LSHSISPFLCWGFTRCLTNYFVQADFEPWSSWVARITGKSNRHLNDIRIVLFFLCHNTAYGPLQATSCHFRIQALQKTVVFKLEAISKSLTWFVFGFCYHLFFRQGLPM
jgi:hypothetical protein